MPFTLSHASATAPFWPLVRRRDIPLCALAIGTLSPDFEYLWRLRTEWRWSHTPLGVLDFCLPAGLVALALWVFVARAPTRHLLALPDAPLALSLRWWLVASVAIVLGAITHLIWDGFTHGFDWAVRLVPVLVDRIHFGSLSIPLFNLLQHASTVIGGLIVLGWLVHDIRRGNPGQLRTPWRLVVFAVLAAITLAVAAWNGLRGGPVASYWDAQVVVSRAGVGALLGLAVGLVAYATLYRLVEPRGPA